MLELQELELIKAGKLLGHVYDGESNRWFPTAGKSLGLPTERIKTVRVTYAGKIEPSSSLTDKRYVLNLKRRQRRFLKKAKKNNIKVCRIHGYRHKKGVITLYDRCMQ